MTIVIANVYKSIQSFKMQWCRVHSSGLAITNITKNTFENRLQILSTRRLATAVCDVNTTQVKKYDEIPGLPSVPIIGPAYNFLPYVGILGAAKSSYEMMERINEKYGTIVRMEAPMKNTPMLMIFDPDDMEYVLRKENTLPIRTGFDSLSYFRKVVKRSFYNEMYGLLTDHGEGWKKFRSTVNPVLMQPRTIKQYEGAIDEVAIDMVKRLKKIRKSDNTIGDSIEVEMNKWALESIGLVGLGRRIGCLEDDLPEDSPARQLIQCVRDSFEASDKLDFRPSLWRIISTPAYRKAMKTYEKQHQISELYIKQAIEDIKKRKPEDIPAEKSVLEKLLEIDEKTALIMASDMLFAGVDTAAHTMMTMLYNLAKNTEAQIKLREEVKDGAERKYLKACIKENQRLSPVVAGNIRKLNQDLKLRNYHIPKGVEVIFPHEYISRQESQYPRAKEFIPERWLVAKDDPLHYSSAHPMATMPFGHGVRSCIGRRIAELELETFLARFIENFEVQWDGPPPTIVTKSLNYMLPPYSYVFKDVK